MIVSYYFITLVAMTNNMDTVISKKDGYLGPFQPKLQVGDMQVLLFCPQDSGPFWMTAEE
jgi:hypothetical protein